MKNILIVFVFITNTLLAYNSELPEGLLPRNHFAEAMERLSDNPLAALLFLAIVFMGLFLFWKFNINGKNNGVK